MPLRVWQILRRILAGILAFFNVVPSLIVSFVPSLFIMFFPIGTYAVLTWPWTVLKDIPDPFHPGESLHWLTYTLKLNGAVSVSFEFWTGLISLSLIVVGSAVFLSSFKTWLLNFKKGGLITHGLYRIVRHPQYFGIILLTLGFSMGLLRPVSFIAWLTLTFGYLTLASLEERNMLKNRKAEYEEYANKTPFMMPFLRFELPCFLSPKLPYRYILFLALWIILTAALIIGTKSLVLVGPFRGSF